VIDYLHACRRGTVLQLAGPEQSGKTLLCMLAAINFILPSEWAGQQLQGSCGGALHLDGSC
jgi:RecA/RadA recombinase